MDIFLVGGGASGKARGGGTNSGDWGRAGAGGGSGYVKTVTNLSASGNVAITIGAGGARAADYGERDNSYSKSNFANPGGNTVVVFGGSTYTAEGGKLTTRGVNPNGGNITFTDVVNGGTDGGSGGGSSRYDEPNSTSANTPSQTSGAGGSNGADGGIVTEPYRQAHGGTGGGVSTIYNGITYAGGGGGGEYHQNNTEYGWYYWVSAGPGGAGGGGAGGTDGTANTGGGGGGGCTGRLTDYMGNPGHGGAGGSGVVVIHLY